MHDSHIARTAPRAERDTELAAQRRALKKRADELGATAEELQAALGALALQAEQVLHRLRGGKVH